MYTNIFLLFPLDLAARTGTSLFQELKNVLFTRVSYRAIRSISLGAFNHLLQLDHSFHVSRNTGAITKSIDRAVKGLGFLFNSLVFNIIPTTVEIGLVSGLVGYKYGIGYAIISLSTVAVYSAFTIVVSTWRTRIRRVMNAADNSIANKAFDSLTNHESIKAFTAFQHESNAYDRCLADFQKAALRAQSSLCVLNVGQSLIFSLAITTIMLKACNESLLSVGDLVFLNGLMIQLAQPLNFLGSIYREIRQALIDIDGLLGFTGRSTKISDNQSTQLMVTKGQIEFKQVTFDYGQADKTLLNNFSLTIPGGSKVAIVGESGCGKSTLSRLLLRFYNPISGSISVDGQEIQSVSLDSLRSQISIVPQDINLFNNSIEYNIKYGRMDATKEQVEEAAKRANIHRFIQSLPEGYRTNVGERGNALSGGEKQRIAIARCLLKDAPIIVLDEATSSLDPGTEAQFVSLMRSSEMKNKTFLMIAHRLTSVRHADLIVVLGKGGVVLESGSHDTLMQIPNGKYRSMYLQSDK